MNSEHVEYTVCIAGILGGLDCTPDPTSGRYYLDIQPSIECDRGLPDYREIFDKAIYGILLWLGLFGIIVKNFLSEGGKYRYSFLTTKVRTITLVCIH